MTTMESEDVICKTVESQSSGRANNSHNYNDAENDTLCELVKATQVCCDRDADTFYLHISPFSRYYSHKN